MTLKTVELTKVGDFSEALSGRAIVSIGVGPNGEALVLAKPRTNVVYGAAVLWFGPEFGEEIELGRVAAKHPYVQPLPNGQTLLVAGRVRGKEHNATVYSAQGEKAQGEALHTFVCGDGIEDVQVAADGSIWVSFFDEGVFGDFPWAGSGLVRFDANGKLLWQFEPPAGCGYMADCYAMNVASRYAWVCYYTDFPIVRVPLSGQPSTFWPNEYGGAHTLATDNQRMLLFGGYKKRNRCVVQEFGDGKMVRAREIELTLPDAEMPERLKAIGRGSVLHLFHGTAWYQLDLWQHDV